MMNMTKFLLSDFNANYKITIENVSERVNKIRYTILLFRIGLYLFCLYTIVCKRKGRIPQMGRLHLLSISLIMEKQFADIIDMNYELKHEN